MTGFDERVLIVDPIVEGSQTIGKKTFCRNRGLSVTSYFNSCCVTVGDSTQTATSTRFANVNRGLVVNFTHRPTCCVSPLPSCVSIVVTGIPVFGSIRLHVAPPDVLRRLVWSSIVTTTGVPVGTQVNEPAGQLSLYGIQPS
jgi:hypothetical protein